MIHWLFYPRSRAAPPLALAVIQAFQGVGNDIDSAKHDFDSNGVLSKLAAGLRAAGFRVESGKAKADKISVAVLFGLDGRLEKSFDADAYS